MKHLHLSGQKTALLEENLNKAHTCTFLEWAGTNECRACRITSIPMSADAWYLLSPRHSTCSKHHKLASLLKHRSTLTQQFCRGQLQPPLLDFKLQQLLLDFTASAPGNLQHWRNNAGLLSFENWQENGNKSHKDSLVQHLQGSTAYSLLMRFYYFMLAHFVKFTGVLKPGFRKVSYLPVPQNNCWCLGLLC